MPPLGIADADCPYFLFSEMILNLTSRMSQKTGSPTQNNKSNKNTCLQTWPLLLRDFYPLYTRFSVLSMVFLKKIKKIRANVRAHRGRTDWPIGNLSFIEKRPRDLFVEFFCWIGDRVTEKKRKVCYNPVKLEWKNTLQSSIRPSGCRL